MTADHAVMTDHAARAVELADEFPDVALVHAVLAVAEAVVGKVQRPRWDDDLRNATYPPASRASLLAALDRTWDAVTSDPTPAPDHPQIATERGQERPNGAGDVRGAVKPDATAATEAGGPSARGWIEAAIGTLNDTSEHNLSRRINGADDALRRALRAEARERRQVAGQRDRLREGIRDISRRLAESDRPPAHVVQKTLLALLADDPTHTNPITVHGIPAEDHHAHVCPVCRRVREEKP